uniref:N-acetyltransferase domain-containing protein n=1 Tax=viral metagenome TaxID=1070528 RepID=A0A6C0LEA9_9ZZZZ
MEKNNNTNKNDDSNIINLKERLNTIETIYDKSKFIINLFKLLSQLTVSPILKYDDVLSIVNNFNDNHYIYFYENFEKVPIGIITLLIEQKLIHGGKCVGHIEDLVVDNNYKGKRIASQLINHCIKIAEEKNCYKIILDCKKELIPFYNKNDFIQQGVCMRKEI